PSAALSPSCYSCWLSVLALHQSFPTRRSSDVAGRCPFSSCHRGSDTRIRAGDTRQNQASTALLYQLKTTLPRQRPSRRQPWQKSDRTSTRLNSSHVWSSYAVLFLKKTTTALRD